MKQTVLFIHGANCTPDSFTYLMAGMPDRFVCDYVMYDACRSSIKEIIEDIATYHAIKAQSPVHIVGHSLGGVIAANLSHAIPEWVASVTTIAAPFCGIELPFFARLFALDNVFIQNVSSRNVAYARSQAKLPVPLQVLKTYGGNNPLLGVPNDGVIPLVSQLHQFADKQCDVPWNHFEVLLHPSTRTAITDFVDSVTNSK